MSELAPRCIIVLASLHGDVVVTTPEELLPGSFGAEALASIGIGDQESGVGDKNQ